MSSEVLQCYICYMKISEGFVIFVALIQLAKDAAWILMTGQLHQDGWDIEEFPTVVHAECLGQLEHEACEYSEGKVVATERSEVLKVDKAVEDWEELGRAADQWTRKNRIYISYI